MLEMCVIFNLFRQWISETRGADLMVLLYLSALMRKREKILVAPSRRSPSAVVLDTVGRFLHSETYVMPSAAN